MVLQTVGPIKGQVAILADEARFGKAVVLWARVWRCTMTGPASPAFAGMILCIFVIIAFVTHVAPITAVHEPRHSRAALVVLIAF